MIHSVLRALTLLDECVIVQGIYGELADSRDGDIDGVSIGKWGWGDVPGHPSPFGSMTGLLLACMGVEDRELESGRVSVDVDVESESVSEAVSCSDERPRARACVSGEDGRLTMVDVIGSERRGRLCVVCVEVGGCMMDV